MLIGALGCNLAWGIIDGVLYLMGCLADKGRNLMTLRAVPESDRSAESPTAGRWSAAATHRFHSPTRGTRLHSRAIKPDSRTAILRPPRKRDWLGALGVFLWVFLTTLPVAIPFMFIHNARLAMRISNVIAVLLLFITGFVYGGVVGRSRKIFGIVMVVLGGVLVALTIALGG